MKRYAFALISFLCLIVGLQTALGWGSGGHMMVAAIAYGRLNPTAKAEVDRLLSLGATRVDSGGVDGATVMMADPDGNEFCISGPR